MHAYLIPGPRRQRTLPSDNRCGTVNFCPEARRDFLRAHRSPPDIVNSDNESGHVRRMAEALAARRGGVAAADSRPDITTATPMCAAAVSSPHPVPTCLHSPRGHKSPAGGGSARSRSVGRSLARRGSRLVGYLSPVVSACPWQAPSGCLGRPETLLLLLGGVTGQELGSRPLRVLHAADGPFLSRVCIR